MTTRRASEGTLLQSGGGLRRIPDSDVIVKPIAGGLAVAAHTHLGALFWTRFEPADIAELDLPVDGVSLFELKEHLLCRVDALAAKQIEGARRRRPRWDTR